MPNIEMSYGLLLKNVRLGSVRSAVFARRVICARDDVEEVIGMKREIEPECGQVNAADNQASTSGHASAFHRISQRIKCHTRLGPCMRRLTSLEQAHGIAARAPSKSWLG